MPLNTDLDALLPPLGNNEPCGPNLEYTPDFLQLEAAARPQAGHDSIDEGGTRISMEAQGPDWAEVRRLAESLLEHTRDIRVAVYYTRALLRTEGFSGIKVGLHLILTLLREHWAHVHPQLDADDNNDPTMRVNALAALVANDAALADLRASWLLRSRQSGELTVRDIEVSQGKLAARNSEQVFSEAQVRAMLAEAINATPGLAGAITDSHQLVRELSDYLQTQTGTGASLDFQPLQNTLAVVQQLLSGITPTKAADEKTMDEYAQSDAPVAPVNISGHAAPGEIRSRADVIAIIDRLVAHLESTEPSNPAQWLLRRAQRVMNMNFLEAIVELAPDALEQTERMVGSRLHPGSQE